MNSKKSKLIFFITLAILVIVFIITIFLWGLYLKQDKIDRNKNKIYDLIEKTIEISENK